MNKVLGLAILLLALPLLSYGQARNTGIKLKGPLYQDNVLILTKNLLQIRTEIPFYLYTYAQETYKGKPSTPTLLGARFERLINAKLGYALEVEYNGYQAKKRENDRPLTTPWKQSTFKIQPVLRKYFRSNANRKRIYNGIYIQGGLTLMSTQQILSQTRLPSGVYEYDAGTVFGANFGAGAQHAFGDIVVIGVGTELIFCGQNFKQENWQKYDIGNGALFLNPFKFYAGVRF